MQVACLVAVQVEEIVCPTDVKGSVLREFPSCSLFMGD